MGIADRVKSADGGSGDFLKLKEADSAALIIFEPIEVISGVYTAYKSPEHKDVIKSGVTIFQNADELKKGTPSVAEVLLIDHSITVKALKGFIDEIAVNRFEKKDTGKGNPARVLAKVSNEAMTLAVKYLEQRESGKLAAKVKALPEEFRTENRGKAVAKSNPAESADWSPVEGDDDLDF